MRQWKAAHGEGDHRAVIPRDPEVSQEGEVDWGTASVWMAGQLRQIKLFVMRSRYSGKPFLRAYPWERQQMFFDAHMRAFAYYGGVFRQLVYDNLTAALLDRLTHHCHIYEFDWESIRLTQSLKRKSKRK